MCLHTTVYNCGTQNSTEPFSTIFILILQTIIITQPLCLLVGTD